YVLALRGRYEESSQIVAKALDDADRFRLTFARPYIEWTAATSAVGLRNFAAADRLLRRGEALAADTDNLHQELNNRVLRARLLLAQHRPDEAIAMTSPEWET